MLTKPAYDCYWLRWSVGLGSCLCPRLGVRVPKHVGNAQATALSVRERPAASTSQNARVEGKVEVVYASYVQARRQAAINCLCESSKDLRRRVVFGQLIEEDRSMIIHILVIL